MDMNDRNAVAEAARKALAEKQAQTEQEAQKLEELLATPISDEEARAQIASVAMREARLMLARQQVLGHLNEIDQQLAACRCLRAEIDCRLTLPAPSTAEAGEQGETK